MFQRVYRWETSQWSKLWESIIDIQNPEKRGNHFMGFLVFVPGLPQPGQNTTFHLIDGQQRLTTTSILLAALRNVARSTKQPELADEIHNDLLVHQRKKGEQRYRLLPKKRDHDSYVAIISGDGEPSGRMADALEFFEDQVKASGGDDGQHLRGLFDTICQRLEFMCATLEAENAYNIFKSLNSTGVPLGQSDLIRNFVFMHLAPDEQDEFAAKLWEPLEKQFIVESGTLDEERFSKFFRDYLMADGRYIQPKATFASFEARYEATGFSPHALARSLMEGASDYAVISGHEADSDEAVDDALKLLNALESSTTYPLLLSLFQRRSRGTISSPQLAVCIDMLRGFILRRFIVGESSRGYGPMFLRALSKETGDTIKTLEDYLLDRGWPDDHQFENAFAVFPLYQRAYAREVLQGLERARGHKEPANLAPAQIEHIMPQTLNDSWRTSLGAEAERIQADWLHTPGNLTLSAYNPELFNHPFSRKKEGYAESNIGITRELSQRAVWGETEIRQRGRELAEQAAKIWIGPKETYIRPLPPDDGEDQPGWRELRPRFWRGLSEHLSEQYPELPDFESDRLTPTIRLSSGLRHIGFELRFSLRQQHAGIDIWFWREASLPLFERIRESPEDLETLLGVKFEFDPPEGRRSRGRILLSVSAPVREEASWPAVYRWIGEKLTVLYESAAPKLREEMDRTVAPLVVETAKTFHH